MVRPSFTVLLPINRSPELLPFAVESVLKQSNADFELFIICDGAPDATVACAKGLAERHPQLRVFSFEKGERHGEAHRDLALREARAPLIAQIGDDDLWLPDHLAILGTLLESVDFGNLLQAELLTDGSIAVHIDDLADETTRQRMCSTPWNFFGPSVAGYRLSAYRSLPVGWSPAPPDVWTDLHMWRKFLRHESLTFGTSFSVQCLKLSAHSRQTVETADRAKENAPIAQALLDPRQRLIYQERAMKAVWQQLKEQYRVADADRTELRQAKDAAASNFKVTEERLLEENRRLEQQRLDQTSALVANFDAERQKLLHDVERLDRLRLDANSTLAEIKSSRSWAMTAPLRWIESKIERRKPR
ncbi:glycosyltransferase family A protein [Ensifer sp. ENS03]|uniref:glycosyltransferase family 2 protein n=1 Tax=Ensifer sp. ENS03 TaxID=2769283 RepID=UPI0017859684|nr:glycosyltransferase family A protein [Ensifer sp. ENS03]MBD9559548.1 glycosyltransferase [Ensifer sp. ENS03]